MQRRSDLAAALYQQQSGLRWSLHRSIVCLVLSGWDLAGSAAPDARLAGGGEHSRSPGSAQRLHVCFDDFCVRTFSLCDRLVLRWLTCMSAAMSPLPSADSSPAHSHCCCCHSHCLSLSSSATRLASCPSQEDQLQVKQRPTDTTVPYWLFPDKAIK